MSGKLGCTATQVFFGICIGAETEPSAHPEISEVTHNSNFQNSENKVKVKRKVVRNFKQCHQNNFCIVDETTGCWLNGPAATSLAGEG